MALAWRRAAGCVGEDGGSSPDFATSHVGTPPPPKKTAGSVFFPALQLSLPPSAPHPPHPTPAAERGQQDGCGCLPPR